MKYTKWLRATALALCSVFVFSACGFLGSSPEPADSDRRVIPYSEMEYTRPDTDAIKARLAEITEEIKTTDNFDTLIELDDESSELVSHFSTMRTLAMLKTYQDSSDTFSEEEYRYCQDRGVELGNIINDLNRAIIEGPFAEQYREYYGDYVFKSIESSLLLNSPEVEPLKQRRNQLNIDYNNMLSTLTLEKDGDSYTMEDIWSSPDYDTYYTLASAYYKENVEAFADIYIEMIALEKEIAQTLGFESVPDMYYLSYSRDYTPMMHWAIAKAQKRFLCRWQNR